MPWLRNPVAATQSSFQRGCGRSARLRAAHLSVWAIGSFTLRSVRSQGVATGCPTSRYIRRAPQAALAAERETVRSVIWAMSPQSKSVVWVLGVLVALVGATIVVATALVAVLDIRPTAASFCAAFLVAMSLALYGECHQRWARAFWGAPFEVGDRVRIVRGLGAGAEATVVELGQGVELEVEFDKQGDRQRRRLHWGGLRRIGPTWSSTPREPTSRDQRNRES